MKFHTYRRRNLFAEFSGWLPLALVQRYELQSIAPKRTTKIGIVSLGGSFYVADTSAAFVLFGLPAPSVSYVSVRGAVQSPDPGGSDVENALDLQWAAGVYTAITGQAANLVI